MRSILDRPRVTPLSAEALRAQGLASMGRTSGFAIRWPVTFSVEDGRTFSVALAEDGGLRICVEGAGEWLDMDRHHIPSLGAVVGCSLRWWYDTMGERLFLTKRTSSVAVATLPS